MGLSKVAWRAIITSFVVISALIGGIAGVVLTDGLLRLILVASIIGFGAYLVFLFITLLVLYTVLYRVAEVNRDK